MKRREARELGDDSSRTPLVRPVPQKLFARELARFWPKLAHPEVALEDTRAPSMERQRFQVDLLAVDDQQRLVLVDAKWDPPPQQR